MITRTITINVDVALSEFETVDLLDEIESRGADFECTESEEVYNLFATGKTDGAVIRCKRMIEQATGRILP